MPKAWQVDDAKARFSEFLEASLKEGPQIVAGFGALSVDAPVFRESAWLKHRKSDTLIEDAMIAATASVHRLIVATRNIADFEVPGVEVVNPFSV